MPTDYEIGFNDGRFDFANRLEMTLCNAVQNTQRFNGYFHGYSGNTKYNNSISEQRQENILANIKKFNFVD